MKRLLWVTLLISTQVLTATAGILKGKIVDHQTGEPLTGATILIQGTKKGAVADLDGNYSIQLKDGKYDILVRYVGYISQSFKDVQIKGTKVINVKLKTDATNLKDVVVVGDVKKNTETAQISGQRYSLVVQSGVSAQMITKTQDKDASEVIKRIPGVSIINDKFVMVRGLSQRYNNVWINGGAVPSSEPDTRAFSFDLIPSSQIDNMMVIKSPAPEYPADFTGGFILVQTKEIPSKNSLSINFSTGINDQTQFKPFLYAEGSRTDFLGFDGGLRSLKNGINTVLPSMPNKQDTPDQKHISLIDGGFNNNWMLKDMKARPNAGLSVNFTRHWMTAGGIKLGSIGSFNYSNGYATSTDMDNNFFGAYNEVKGESTYLRKAKDDQYKHSVRIGALLNLSISPSMGSTYEFKNIFNQLGSDRYTSRVGIDAQDNHMQSAEYNFSSRTTYNGQLTGKHTHDRDYLDWSMGYAYSNKEMPDRRRYIISDQFEPGKLGLYNSNDINREYTSLNEHIGSANVNYKHRFAFKDEDATVKGGLYGEYRKRDYRTRDFIYNWEGQNDLPSGFQYFDVPTELMQPANYGPDKMYLIEKPKWTNNYGANNRLLASYLSGSLPLGQLSIYAGIRFEHNQMELIRNTRDEEPSPYALTYKYNDFFPSINTTYKMKDNSQLRLSYGRTVNRPEFREVSPSVFYDFELGSYVQGNTDLKPAYIDNYDLRYEFYPQSGEMASIALFYKNFKNPIEWTYTMTGGTDPVYSFKNANSAYSVGVELDLKKNLAFVGLKDFSLSLNAALIKSHVRFDEGAKERNRPMQGQSPYLINSGLFYHNDKHDLNVSVLYNRIGRRIIGVGRTVGATGEVTVNIPDAYEMPRNLLDINISKKFGGHFMVKASLRDVFAEKVTYKQFNDVMLSNGTRKEVVETTKSYYPGRNFNLSVSYIF